MVLFQGCATWYGIKQDSKDAWKVATKQTTGEVYDSTKELFMRQQKINNNFSVYLTFFLNSSRRSI